MLGRFAFEHILWQRSVIGLNKQNDLKKMIKQVQLR